MTTDELQLRHNAMCDVSDERERQNEKWGGVQDLTAYQFLAVASEELGEAAQAALHDEFGGSHAGTLRAELVQLAAVVVQWIERIDMDQAAALADIRYKLGYCNENGTLVTASDIRQVMDDYGFSVDLDVNGEHDDVSQTLLSMTEEVARLRVENRLLAAHDLDALLDSSRVIQTVVMDGLDGGYEADIAVGRGDDSAGGYDKYRATGKTFTAAIRNAVAQATTTQEGTRNG